MDIVTVDRREHRASGARTDLTTHPRCPVKPAYSVNLNVGVKPTEQSSPHKVGRRDSPRWEVEVGSQEAPTQGTILQAGWVCLQLPIAMHSGKPGSGLAGQLKLGFQKGLWTAKQYFEGS